MLLLNLEHLVVLLELEVLVQMKVALLVLTTGILQVFLAGDADWTGRGATQWWRRCIKRSDKSWEVRQSYTRAVMVFRVHAGRKLVEVGAVQLVMGEVAAIRLTRGGRYRLLKH
jgi:hypothetical protein